MIAVIDTGVANIASVMAALARLGAEAKVTSHAEEIIKASHVIFPGVGAAPAAMAKLREKKLDGVIQQLKQPVLGICLGMQLLFERSEEGDSEGLGILNGSIKKLEASKTISVPHMGWNRIEIEDSKSPLLRGIEDGAFMYFVHSYAAPVSGMTLAATEHGQRFSAVVNRDNFYGVQFHPERSSLSGALLLQNFLSV